MDFSTLNARQQEAVKAPFGNSLILAGAGSGKTRVLVSRIAWLVQQHDISVGQILAVTFTNKAANEMRTRLTDLLDHPSAGLWVGTFHGIAHRLLRKHYRESRLPENFQILDVDEQSRIVKRIIVGMSLNIEQWPVKSALSFINAQKEEGIRSQQLQVLPYGPSRTWATVYKAYEHFCQQEGLLDFSELLLRTFELFRDNAELLAYYQDWFRAILVDEFQDTNTIQYALLRLLAGPNTSVMVVGDDDQSIYAWRGAKVGNIRQFSDDFQGVVTVRLEQNYRSSANILNAANALIDNNTARMGKSLWTAGETGEKIVLFRAFNELEEARWLCEQTQTLLDEGVVPTEIAVLYRSNAQSRVLEEALLRAGIPYRIHGGMRYFERSEIKDAIAYLRLILRLDDNNAFERIINVPARGIGEKTLEIIQQHAEAEQLSLWAAMTSLLENRAFSPRVGQALSKFSETVLMLAERVSTARLDEVVEMMLEHTELLRHYAKSDRVESKSENLQELVHAARQFSEESVLLEEGQRPLSLFLAHIALEVTETSVVEDIPTVQLMTLHSAKGLEFPVVFMVGVEEGVFPSHQSLQEPERLEEERRLCYVGMTRAMHRLYMSYATLRRQYGREERHRPSRFLREIPPNLLQGSAVESPMQAQTNFMQQQSSVSQAGEFYIGQTVCHPKFKEGVILGAKGNGPQTQVQVNFKAVGIKWLVLAYANLTIAELG